MDQGISCNTGVEILCSEKRFCKHKVSHSIKNGQGVGAWLACRGALPADSPALLGWKTDSPLLVMGSHTWNTPNEKGRLFCDGVRQARVFSSAASR